MPHAEQLVKMYHYPRQMGIPTHYLGQQNGQGPRWALSYKVPAEAHSNSAAPKGGIHLRQCGIAEAMP
jgi:hypothetical protein